MDDFDIDFEEESDVCDCGHSADDHSTEVDDGTAVLFHDCVVCGCEGFWRE